MTFSAFRFKLVMFVEGFRTAYMYQVLRQNYDILTIKFNVQKCIISVTWYRFKFSLNTILQYLLNTLNVGILLTA